MNIETIYETLNNILSPWLLAGLGALQFFLAFRLGRRWRMLTIALIGAAGIVVFIVYLLFGFEVLVELLYVRVAGRIAVTFLLVAINSFLAAALMRVRDVTNGDSRGKK